jgi:hypothetical protein
MVWYYDLQELLGLKVVSNTYVVRTCFNDGSCPRFHHVNEVNVIAKIWSVVAHTLYKIKYNELLKTWDNEKYENGQCSSNEIANSSLLIHSAMFETSCCIA